MTNKLDQIMLDTINNFAHNYSLAPSKAAQNAADDSCEKFIRKNSTSNKVVERYLSIYKNQKDEYR